jgi:murein DD-endopeptidase MepM/ murein hydrolase activator NlpD
MARQLALMEPMLEGSDIEEVQRLLGFTGAAVDGVFGQDTAAAVEEWKWQVGYPADKINSVLGLIGLSLLKGETSFPRDFKARAKTREGLPFGAKKVGDIVMPLASKPHKGSEFRIVDAEGAKADDGRRYHAGFDWFSPGGSAVRAPIDGTIIEVKPRKKDTGQVFGGTVKIQGPDGKVWVFRHVDPKVAVGAAVKAGQRVAAVTPWKSGPSHAHIEVWKTFGGGYDFENMLDPRQFF